MKKRLALLVALVLALGLLAGCGGSKAPQPSPTASPSSSPDASSAPTETEGELKKIIVGASPTPHALILEAARQTLLEKGYELEIVEFTDYVQPNVALADGSIDANFFQHTPYLDDYNAERGTDLVSLVSIHFEPLGLYPGKTSTLDELKDGAQIAVPNDTTNEARALLLLEAQGLITVKPDAGLKATINDITSNPKNLKIIEIEAAQLARSLQDVDMAVINGNYALSAGLVVGKDALAAEDSGSVAAQTFANIVAVRAGDESREDLVALVEALTSDAMRQYIEGTFEGSVVPVF
jgi:D-methionine transport system substrate-binding protein